jgi:hypothetical protein
MVYGDKYNVVAHFVATNLGGYEGTQREGKLMTMIAAPFRGLRQAHHLFHTIFIFLTYY